MTRASERLRITTKPQAEISEQTAKKKTMPGWSEEEEKALIESLKIHKWGDWEAMAADVKTRTVGATETKVRCLSKMSSKANDSAVKRELIALSNIRWTERLNETKSKDKVSEEPSNGQLKDESNFQAIEPSIEEAAIQEDVNEKEVLEAPLEDIEPEKIDDSSDVIGSSEVQEAENIASVVEETQFEEKESDKVPEISEVSEPLENSNPEPVESVAATDDVKNVFEPSNVVMTPEPIEETPLIPAEPVTEINPEVANLMSEPEANNQVTIPEVDDVTSVPEVNNEVSVPEVNNEVSVPEVNNLMPEPEANNEVTEPEAVVENVPMTDATPQEKKKGGRKPRNTTQPAPPIKSPAKSPAKAAVKKRTYTRKTKATAAAPVNTGEEVSILSSSESAGSAKESINIMSSSDSLDSIPSLASEKPASEASVASSKKSVKSTKSTESASSIKSASSTKSTKSTKSDKSAKSDKSTKSSVSKTSPKSLTSSASSSSVDSESEIAPWIREACPAIFENSQVKRPVIRYKQLKSKILKIIEKNSETRMEELVSILNKDFNAKSIEQVFGTVKQTQNEYSDIPATLTDGVDTTAKKPAKKGKKKSLDDMEKEELELLKKMSSISSGRKRKIRSEDGEWIDPNEIEGRVISHEPAKPLKEKRKRKTVKKNLEDDDLNTTEDPFRLILLHEFDEQGKESQPGQVDENGDEYELVKAPFRVEICTSVILLMDLHSHLHSSEIIGLLGGVFIKSESLPVLRINYGFPCSTAHSTGTQVDVDPLSEMEAGSYFESNGVRMAGWYHSHPNFEPNPSLRDLETQTMYQGLFKNSIPDSNVEPFVGVIVNPYMAVTESSSHVECFYIAPTIDPTQERLPYRLPIERVLFDPEIFPQILDKMREIVFKAESSPDRLDMRKNAQPGVKRIDKLFASLKWHGNLSDEQMEQVKNLFDN